jgi:hypothetical protein
MRDLILIFIAAVALFAVYIIDIAKEKAETRTLSISEEAWIVDCLDRLTLIHGLKTAKRLCFEKEYELNNLGYFDE